MVTDVYTASSMEGYFSHSQDNDGDYCIAGLSGGHHLVQNRNSDGHRLLFTTLDEGEIESDLSWVSRGIECYISPDQVVGERRCVVECSDPMFFPAMNRVIATILQEEITGADNVISLFRGERLFWSNIPNLMTLEKATGLFGELYFMFKWLPKQLPYIIINEIWTGPLGTSKDFNSDQLQIEVKTAMSQSNPTQHKISSLYQLLEEGRPLVLFSLVAQPVESGGESLCDLAESIICILNEHSDDLVEKFKDLLEENDYIYGDPRMEQYCFIPPIVDGNLFAVTDHFPRLVPDDDVDDDRIHLESYRISLSGVDDLNLNLSPETSLDAIVSAYNLITQ